MMIKRFALTLLFSFWTNVEALTGSDYIDTVPPTVYEAEEVSPQNMDFDKVNNLFVAHSGWLNDREIHYYKFRIFAPGTYPGVIEMDSNFADVPMQQIYMTTTTGDFEGVVGNPIIQFHTVDGNDYSDFMEVVFVTVSEDYVANTYRSVGDVTKSELPVTASGIIMNIPVVPTGSKLQHPATKGTNVAPISSVLAWYQGVEVETYVFEVTDTAAKEHFSFTRSEPDSTDFGISVTNFANAERTTAIPLLHFNQFSRGVTDANAGGPSPDGMRNVINLDRPDAGYSPLWQLFWLTQLPVNYVADQLSNIADFSEEDGFVSVRTPMFVNCPNVGAVGSQENPDKGDNFQANIGATLASNWIQGSDATLILQAGVEVTFQSDTGAVLGQAETNIMGAYQFEVVLADLVGVKSVNVIANENVIHTISVEGETDPILLEDDKDGLSSDAGSWKAGIVVAFVTFLAAGIIF